MIEVVRPFKTGCGHSVQVNAVQQNVAFDGQAMGGFKAFADN